MAINAMIFLLDANVLIDAKRLYYLFSSVPEFWEWLTYQGGQGNIKIPLETYEELSKGNDDLATWIKRKEVKNSLLLKEEVKIDCVQRVIKEGYSDDLTDVDVERLGNDPLIIAHALQPSNNNQRCIVTTENSKPSRKGANRHIPDVCNSLGIKCCNPFELYQSLGFRTKWRESIDQ